MATLNLGRVRPVQRGAWDAATADYKAYDWVTYRGAAWLALKDAPAGYEPDSQPEFWVLFGAKGDKGDVGAQGPRGEQGPAGSDGRDGADGADGAPGPAGPAGPEGAQGPAGPEGPQGPAVPLSNSVVSASETDAASSKAVKTAYDKAVEAREAIVPPDGMTIRTVDGELKAIFPSPYELCEFYYFRHPTLRPGFQPCMGGLLEHAATLYPEAWGYLQTVEGQKLCKTEAEWQAMTTAIWHTNADGTTVGWNGIGGAPYYAPNTATGALRLPDLRGMYAEAAGFDSLGAGGAHGDAIREIWGAHVDVYGVYQGQSYGAFHTSNGQPASIAGGIMEPVAWNALFHASRVVPVAPVNHPRAWGALACCYLGPPAS